MEHSYSEEEIERCTLVNPREIHFQIKNLVKRGERVSVNFQEGRQSFLTVLLGLSEKTGLLYFDIGGSPEINEAFLKSAQCSFVAHVEGVRLQFSAAGAQRGKWQGDEAFVVPLPKKMLRLQRREFFRLQLPSAKPYTCRVRRGAPDEALFPLHDISLGGVGIHAAQPLNYEPLEKLENCWLDLGDNGMLCVTLEVRYVHAIESRSGKPFWHLGCRFVELSPAGEVQIQRFMARIEVERRSLAAE